MAPIPPTAHRAFAPRGASAVVALVAAALLSMPGVGTAQTASATDDGLVPVSLVAINDFHGRLDPVSTPEFGTVGGAAYLAAHVRQVREDHPGALLVDAGDLTGATIGLSHAFGDEPTVEAMNLMGLDVHTAGNHEFDDGLAALRRLREGGCWLDDCGYRGGTSYPGADFTTLSSNIRDAATGELVFPAWTIRDVDGVQIGFVGATDTNSLTPEAKEELDYSWWHEEIESSVAEAEAAGADVIVLLRHIGMHNPSTDIGSCPDDPDLHAALASWDHLVDVIIDAHTHSPYVCDLPDSPLLTQAAEYGAVYTEINLQVDAATGEVVAREVANRVVTHDVAPDAGVAALIDQYEQWWETLYDPEPSPSPMPTDPSPSPTPTTDPSPSPTPTTEPTPSPSPTATSRPRPTPPRRPATAVEVTRMSGTDRVTTAAQLATRFESADTVLLARADHFADALVAGPLAAQESAPLLLTHRDGLAAGAAEQLDRLRPERVVLVGGPGALGSRVEAQVRALPWLASGGVERIAGTDDRREAFLTTGTNYPDALAGAALAAGWRAPVLLTDPATLPDPTRDMLRTLDPHDLVVLGGAAAVSPHVAAQAGLAAGTVARRLAGSDRYATAAAVAAEFDGFTTSFVATGRDFPDALAGVAAAAHEDAPVLLVEPDLLPEAAATQLRRVDTAARQGHVVVVGGTRAVSDEVVDAILRLR